MKTAEKWMKDLLVLMDIEEGADVKSECPEQWNKLSQFLQQIQLDAFKAGMTKAAEIAKDKQIGCLTMTYKLACYEIHDAVLSTRDRKESL